MIAVQMDHLDWLKKTDEDTWLQFLKKEIKSKIQTVFRWLDTFLNLVLGGSDIDAVDIREMRTPLHMAAYKGLVDAVILLLRNATLDIGDKQGKTPLDIAVDNATVVPKLFPFFLATESHNMRQSLCDHEMVVYLLLSYGASFKKCKRSGGSLLHRAILNQQP